MNNAGVADKGTSWDGIEHWRSVFDVNLFGYVFIRCLIFPFILISIVSQNRECATDFCSRLYIVLFSSAAADVGYSTTAVWLQSMIHQENPAIVINTGSKQGITNPPCVFKSLRCCVIGYSSLDSSDGRSGNAAYNASKAAVKSLTEGLAHELRERPSCDVTAHLLMWDHLFFSSHGGTDHFCKPWIAEFSLFQNGQSQSWLDIYRYNRR